MEANEQVRYGILDASAWSQRGEDAPSPAEEMNLSGLSWRPSDRTPNSRKTGKLQVHKYLQKDELTGKRLNKAPNDSIAYCIAKYVMEQEEPYMKKFVSNLKLKRYDIEVIDSE